jgi:hypothetical protein
VGRIVKLKCEVDYSSRGRWPAGFFLVFRGNGAGEDRHSIVLRGILIDAVGAKGAEPMETGETPKSGGASIRWNNRASRIAVSCAAAIRRAGRPFCLPAGPRVQDAALAESPLHLLNDDPSGHAHRPTEAREGKG